MTINVFLWELIRFRDGRGSLQSVHFAPDSMQNGRNRKTSERAVILRMAFPCNIRPFRNGNSRGGRKAMRTDIIHSV